MVASYPDENARLRAQLLEQQNTLRQMAEYNCLLSQRVAAYASEINRLKALVAKLQRMQFGKSSEKLREKTQRRYAKQKNGSMPCRKSWRRRWVNNMIRRCRASYRTARKHACSLRKKVPAGVWRWPQPARV